MLVEDPGFEKGGGSPGVLGAYPQVFFVNFSQFRGLFKVFAGNRAPPAPPPPLDPPLGVQRNDKMIIHRRYYLMRIYCHIFMIGGKETGTCVIKIRMQASDPYFRISLTLT